LQNRPPDQRDPLHDPGVRLGDRKSPGPCTIALRKRDAAQRDTCSNGRAFSTRPLVVLWGPRASEAQDASGRKPVIAGLRLREWVAALPGEGFDDDALRVIDAAVRQICLDEGPARSRYVEAGLRGIVNDVLAAVGGASVALFLVVSAFAELPVLGIPLVPACMVAGVLARRVRQLASFGLGFAAGAAGAGLIVLLMFARSALGV
jgi:hypothetical protein